MEPMPELPEVETVRRGLAPFLVGAAIEEVALNRAGLRFPFPPGFAEALAGRRIEAAERRAKYLLFPLSGGALWIAHLGMTGSFRFERFSLAEPTRYYAPAPARAHDHVRLLLNHPREGRLELVYNDARRFGFMDLAASAAGPAYLRELGPEPLSDAFDAATLARRLMGRTAPIKAALLDQAVVAGLGNIYVSEALFRAGILPTLAAGALVLKSGRPGRRLEALVAAVKAVLAEAIEAGGATLRDFRAADGKPGYFQHDFLVYDREGAPCPRPGCPGTVRRIVQAGRASFYCPVCQH
jgi:formamidopyrimidine-DNA glycosylase